MLVSERRIRVEWGDCDPADIVFYPNYMVWFDGCMTSLFALAGLPLPALFESHEVVGIPVVDVKVKFFAASRFGDQLRAVSSAVEFGRSSFVLRHQFFKGDTLAVEGFEIRVWTGHDPSNPGRLKALPLPKEVIDKLSASRPA
jgi:4-hydroxybenzoyl-CoA thioesterase